MKYDPSQTEETVTNFLSSAFSEIPVVGDLVKVELPKQGEVLHVIRFQTTDQYGYFRQGQLEFTYGSFQRERSLGESGAIVDTVMGPVQARLIVYKGSQQLLPMDLDEGVQVEINKSA